MLYKKKTPLLYFVLPAFAFMLLFLYYPFIVNIVNSFFNLKSIAPIEKPAFIGTENYTQLLRDPKILVSLLNSLKMMILTIVFQVGGALVLALLVNYVRLGSQFFRTVFFFPIVISATAIGLMFYLFYSYNGGMLNQILALFGKEPIFWLDEKTAFTMISIPVIWQYVGFYFVIILTGLNGISDEIYEAADIDGASKFQQAFFISLPLLRNVLITCLVLAVTGALKVFDLPWVIAPHGAPAGVTHFTGTYMYETTFAIGNIDYGSTIAFLIVILGVLVSQLLNRVLKKKDDI